MYIKSHKGGKYIKSLDYAYDCIFFEFLTAERFDSGAANLYLLKVS